MTAEENPTPAPRRKRKTPANNPEATPLNPLAPTPAQAGHGGLLLSLEGEIALLRALNRRLMQFSANPETLDEAIAALRAHGEAAVRIARLMRDHAALSGREDAFQQTMMTALDKVLKEFKIA